MELDSGLDIDALGQATDQTFGRSSTTKCPTWSVKGKLVGQDVLQVDYMCVVTYAGSVVSREVMKKYDDESESVIADAIKAIKAEYKRVCDKKLTTKRETRQTDESIEPVSMNVHSPITRAFYRKRAVFSVK